MIYEPENNEPDDWPGLRSIHMFEVKTINGTGNYIRVSWKENGWVRMLPSQQFNVSETPYGFKSFKLITHMIQRKEMTLIYTNKKI